MARRGYDEYERDIRHQRGQREPDLRERVDRREHRRPEVQDPDRMEYTRESRPDLRTTRDSIQRPIYPYADQNDRDDLPPRGGYMDDPQDRHRPPIDLQPERREEPSSRYQDYFLPGDGIHREVIQYDICRYLGNDATVRPYSHPDVGYRSSTGSTTHTQADRYQGRQGFLIKAYRAPTTAMITTLKQDSKRFEVEAAQRRRQFGQSGRYGQEVQVTRSPNASPGIPYAASNTFDDRQRVGRPDVPQSGYTGYGMDTNMDDYENDREAIRNYRDPEPRMDQRMDIRQDLRPDPRPQPPVGRHNQIPTVYQGYPQGESSYPASYQVQPVSSGPYDQSSQPRTVGPNNTPPPPMGRGGQAIYSGGYPVVTSAGYPITTSATAGGATRYADTANGRMTVNYPGGVPYAPNRPSR